MMADDRRRGRLGGGTRLDRRVRRHRAAAAATERLWLLLAICSKTRS